MSAAGWATDGGGGGAVGTEAWSVQCSAEGFEALLREALLEDAAAETVVAVALHPHA